jgi:hypothetical protein
MRGREEEEDEWEEEECWWCWRRWIQSKSRRIHSKRTR